MDVKFPIGKLETPEKVSLNHVQQWADEVANFSNRLRAVVDDLDSEALSKTYREGSWTVRQLVHHITDSQVNLYTRLKITLTDDSEPKITGFIQDEWVKLPDSQLPIECSIRMLEGINERVVAICREVKEDQLGRIYMHPDDGATTLATTIAKLAWHEEHHLAHIKIALSK
ncbi:YfiT family bacillithiol transferase [Mammaliicoccus sp. Dog046]|uniref:YfiT family bacillithiol transferase n=1 Tax=Mammaliicoccus sp. Dog046 TaxID=3034233 RepID=UPI002B2577E5|nr:putative metal-dependent hydrolase [Mammaliicoccus sp. Dog046]WQK85653.1 putative metal-dependent hydrolase [Mammaliicoccus sp. Dog046]